MTNSLIRPEELPLPDSGVSLTASDAERIATAIEAELAASTRATYDCAWRQWDRWCQGRGINPLPAPPQALAAFLAERAEAGLTFGTLDGYCSGIAHRHHQEGLEQQCGDSPKPAGRLFGALAAGSRFHAAAGP